MPVSNGGVAEESIEPIVVIFPGALGDFLLALPALRALRARHADARATFVVQPSLAALVGLAGVAETVASIDDAETAGLFSGQRTPSWLAARPRVYSWLGADDAEMRARLGRLARGARFFRTERGDGPVHAAVAYARALRVPTARTALVAGAALVPPASPAADALLAAATGPVLALHPGAGARAKRWDVAGFVQVAHWWRSEGGAVVPIAGPAEAGEPPALGGPDVREWPLPDVAAVLSRAALYLGHDSGVSHLAAAVGAAGVVVYGPTDPRRWGPLGGNLVPIRARGGGPDGIPLTALPASRVIAACRRRFALTRGDPDTSVPAYPPSSRL
jgi:heptosyltransferase-2